MFNHASYQRNEQDNRFAARLQFSFPDPRPLPEENNEKKGEIPNQEPRPVITASGPKQLSLQLRRRLCLAVRLL